MLADRVALSRAQALQGDQARARVALALGGLRPVTADIARRMTPASHTTPNATCAAGKAPRGGVTLGGTMNLTNELDMLTTFLLGRRHSR